MVGMQGITVGQYGSIAFDANSFDPEAPVVTDLNHDAFGGWRAFLAAAVFATLTAEAPTVETIRVLEAHETPRTWQYLVNVERQLGANWSMELGYLGSQSRHLYGFQTLNQAGPGPIAARWSARFDSAWRQSREWARLHRA